jgi:hypothetical protein
MVLETCECCGKELVDLSEDELTDQEECNCNECTLQRLRYQEEIQECNCDGCIL